MEPDEARRFFDQQARAIAGIAGEEFLRRYDAGEFRYLPDTPEGRRLEFLVLLIPFGRQDT